MHVDVLLCKLHNLNFMFTGLARFGCDKGCGLFWCGCCILLFASWDYSGSFLCLL